MKRLRLTLEVARWEFTRFYKLKNELKAAAYMIVFGIVGFSVSFLIGRGMDERPELVLVNDTFIAIDSTIYDHFIMHYAGAGEIDAIKTRVGAGDIDGLIVVRSPDEAELYIRNERPWILQLKQLFTDFRRQTIIAELNIPEQTVEYLLRSFVIETVFHDEEAAKGRGIERTFAVTFIIIMLISVFIGFGYQFTAITGEKQQRITEQIVSAISPQTWIDGKILGITAIGITSILFYGSFVLIGGLLFSQYFGPGFFAPLLHVSVWKIAAFLMLSLLGILLWNSFFAAVAATISDPNTSERSAFMLLPVLPVGFAFGALLNPDSLIIKILGVFPLTSSSMLPVRMVITDVAMWEFLLAVMLLLGTIWFFRKSAAKIFSFGMLIYGKEPDIKEMWRWIRES